MHNIIYGEMGHLKNQGFDDWIESVSIYGECRWLAYRAPNFEVYTYILRPNTDYFTGVVIPMKYPPLDLSLRVALKQ